MTEATIIKFQPKAETQFVCSSCGADRGCDCNAPAVERLAQIREDGRQRVRVHRAREKEKAEQNQQLRNVTDDDMPTEAEAEASSQADIYYHACLLVEQMASPTRRRFTKWFHAYTTDIKNDESKSIKGRPGFRGKRLPSVNLALERRPAKRHRTKRKE
jgi:hypothetical protein